MRAYLDRHQRVPVGVVMIETAFEPFAIGDGEIELELVGASPGRIWPGGVGDHRGDVAKVERALPFRLDPRGAVEKSRKLGERDRLLIVEVTRRMTFSKQLCDRRDGFRRCGRELAQI